MRPPILKLPDGLPPPDWCDEKYGVALYCGDCMDVLPKLPKVDAVVTDPPYGINYNCNYFRFIGGVAKQRKYLQIYGDNKPFNPSIWIEFAEVILWGANCYSDKLPCGSWFIWDKRHKNKTAFVSEAEIAWKKGGHGTHIYNETCQGFIRKEKSQHPTQKSVGLMEWCLSKIKSELVLDPFMGSGTTGVACVNLGRSFIGIEIEREYFDISVERIRKAIIDKQNGPLFVKHEPPQLEVFNETDHSTE